MPLEAPVGGGSRPPREVSAGSEGTNDVQLPTSKATTGITIQDAGTVGGPNAPYLQLLVCEKL